MASSWIICWKAARISPNLSESLCPQSRDYNRGGRMPDRGANAGRKSRGWGWHALQSLAHQTSDQALQGWLIFGACPCTRRRNWKRLAFSPLSIYSRAPVSRHGDRGTSGQWIFRIAVFQQCGRFPTRLLAIPAALPGTACVRRRGCHQPYGKPRTLTRRVPHLTPLVGHW